MWRRRLQPLWDLCLPLRVHTPKGTTPEGTHPGHLHTTYYVPLTRWRRRWPRRWRRSFVT
eukprot:scaffold35705_cov21-Phaeocystis_antarctica.AAC.1